MDHLIAELTKDTSNVLTGKVLKVRGLTIQPAPKADGTVDAQDLEAADSDASAYDLSGRYWIRGGAVDVRFAMKRGDGASWPGKAKSRSAISRIWSCDRLIPPSRRNRRRRARSPSNDLLQG